MNYKKRKKSIVAEINITPFTDVVLVVLIIFMITTPMLTQSNIKINLPQAQSSRNEDISNIEILISESGQVYIDGKQIHESTIEETIKSLIGKHPNKAVIVKGDKNVKYDYIIKTMEQAKQAGAVRFALAVDVPINVAQKQ
jgi:biopolymer transport protein ExbD